MHEIPSIQKNAPIYVAGHRGLVGSAIVRALTSQRYTNLICRTHGELDLIDAVATTAFFERERPEYVFLVAAKVGGIMANMTYPADFIYQNLVLQSNVIHAAYRVRVRKLLFLASSSIYSRHAIQPFKEEYFLNSPLEETTEPYAIAKIAGIATCQAYNKQYGTHFLSAIPANLYGPNDKFDLDNSHVIPGLIRRFHDAKMSQAKSVSLWGTGAARREFLYVDDLAEACLFLMGHYDDSEIINVGTGEDVSIRELAELVKETVGFHGSIVWDATKPDGTPKKVMDITRITKLGWKARTKLRDGIHLSYEWYLRNCLKHPYTPKH
ncbi:MAG: NAD-dependent epimerase/dehydratase [Parcubacteria group bacterium GW2011_GWA2_49_9]|nr:MAG: NAD-dependent epimerase/dehydratase [Parcubacteria group bacterium GW2011_GWA2_49_9]